MNEKILKADLTRRGFIKSSAIGVGALALTSISSKDSTAATIPKKWDMEADVVVVGAGAAGLAAAVEAVENKASVILLEKQPLQGGSSSVSTGSILCTGSQLQRQAGVQDSPDALIKYLKEVNENLCDEQLVRTLAENVGSDMDWLAGHGVEFIKGVYTVMGSPVARALLIKGAGSGLTTPLFNKAKEKGVRVLLNTRGEKIFQNHDGRIAGLSVKDRSGKIRNVKARKAIILASGGFCSSPDFLMRFASAFYYNISASAPSSTGDGTGMALRLGADVIHIDAILPTPTVEFSSRILITSYVLDTGAGILVGEDGKRFGNETGGYFDTAMIAGAQIRSQKKNKFVWEIFGKNAREKVPRVDSYLKGGMVIEADTIEELAGKLGLDAGILKETVSKYNEAVEKKKDAEFGRQSLKAKLEPKFGAMKVAPGNLVSPGGLRVNKDSQILDMDGKVIRGLYAAGEVAGGISVRGTVGGDYLGAAVVFGRIAGRKAVAEKPWK